MKIQDEQTKQALSEKHRWTEQQFGSVSILSEIWEDITPIKQLSFNVKIDFTLQNTKVVISKINEKKFPRTYSWEREGEKGKKSL